MSEVICTDGLPGKPQCSEPGCYGGKYCEEHAPTPDPTTTERQKANDFALLQECVDYLETHGLDKITRLDLKHAAQYLDNHIDYGVR